MNYCITCNQGVDDLPNCTKCNLVYENICSICNPGALKKGELKEQESKEPSLYVGEMSKSVQERGQEQ